MSALIWLHEDALRADHPLFAAACENGETAPACFIWDDAYMADMGYGLKRRVFIYETLAEMNVEIYAGPLVTTLKDLAARHKATHIITGKTPNPLLKSTMADMRETIKLSAIADKAFVQMDMIPELKRFFKYWNKAKKKAFLFDGRA